MRNVFLVGCHKLPIIPSVIYNTCVCPTFIFLRLLGTIYYATITFVSLRPLRFPLPIIWSTARKTNEAGKDDIEVNPSMLNRLGRCRIREGPGSLSTVAKDTEDMGPRLWTCDGIEWSPSYSLRRALENRSSMPHQPSISAWDPIIWLRFRMTARAWSRCISAAHLRLCFSNSLWTLLASLTSFLRLLSVRKAWGGSEGAGDWSCIGSNCNVLVGSGSAFRIWKRRK